MYMCDIKKDKNIFQILNDFGRKINGKKASISILRMSLIIQEFSFIAVFVNPYCITFLLPEYTNH